MSSQEWGEDSGAEVPASSRRSSIALASLQDSVFRIVQPSQLLFRSAAQVNLWQCIACRLGRATVVKPG